MSNLQKNKWKYSTIGLLAVLAVGFSFPQAIADVTNNMQHMIQHVYEDTQAIKAKTDTIPADMASNTVVNTRASQESVDTLASNVDNIASSAYGSQIVRSGVWFSGGESLATVQVNSTRDFTVCYIFNNELTHASSRVVIDEVQFRIPIEGNLDGCLGGNAGEEIIIQGIHFAHARGVVTVISSADAAIAITGAPSYILT